MVKPCVLLLALVVQLIVSGAVTADEAGSAPKVAEPWRAVHLGGYLNDAHLEQLIEHVPILADMGINVIILEVDYAFNFKSHPELRLSDTPVTKDGAERLTRHCREHGIRFIPQFQCLGHQSWKRQTSPLLIKYPEFDLTPGKFPNNEGIYCREWDPLNPRVNEIVFKLMDELIEAFQADAFHVGMDEVFLLGSEHSPSTKGKDPAKLFAKAVNDYYEHLVKTRGVEMLMWGDRLIDGEKMRYGTWESSRNGTAGAVDMIPRDIIICDWHYRRRRAYPSIPMFLEKGFRVLPAGWNRVEATRALIGYAKQQESPNMLGHLFTTWDLKRGELTRYPPLVQGLEILMAHEKCGNKQGQTEGKMDAVQNNPPAAR